jgi:putative transposase
VKLQPEAEVIRMEETQDIPELSHIAPEKWEEARRRAGIIRPLAEKPDRTVADMKAAAAQIGLKLSQLYELLGRYIADPRLTALLPRSRGGIVGRFRLSHELEILIDKAIEEVYLTRQKAKIKDLVLEIRKLCHGRGLTPPGRTAITARVRAKPAKEVVRRRQGGKAAQDQFRPVTGYLESVAPMALVQIDHTLVDVIVVDSVSRAPIQRPWLTLAIDVYSRCVVGFYLSLEPPSATSVALCIAHATLPKQPWLALRNIEADWPIEGLMTRLHLDNAKEFRSEALRRGCDQYGIGLDYRPVRTPRYGGHIERLIGTMMGKVHLLPGTTFSDIEEKGNLDPEKTAAMTIDELDRWLGLSIAGDYHLSLHRALGGTPLVAWKRGIESKNPGFRAPRAVQDPRRLLIDFLPIERRLVRRDGISLHSIHYWSDVLSAWVGEQQKMIVRYDPRDLSRIFLLAPDNHYYDIAYRDLRRPPISLWEHRLALKRLQEEGRSQYDEAAIFRTIDAMRSIVDDAVNASKAMRRHRERRLQVIKGGRVDPGPSRSQADLTLLTGEEEVSTGQPWENMLPVEEWT